MMRPICAIRSAIRVPLARDSISACSRAAAGHENINTPIKAYRHLDRSSTEAIADVIGKMLHLKSTLALDNWGTSDKQIY